MFRFVFVLLANNGTPFGKSWVGILISLF